jgi:hypothetical protein
MLLCQLSALIHAIPAGFHLHLARSVVAKSFSRMSSSGVWRSVHGPSVRVHEECS